MRRFAYICLALALTACGICKQKPVIEHRDSIRVEVHERLVHSTAYFAVPAISASIVTADTCSRLENDWAISKASIEGGLLHHSLETKPQQVAVPVNVAVTDTTTYHDHADTQYIEVERDFTGWERFRLDAFWWLIVLVVIGFRREIIALIKKL